MSIRTELEGPPLLTPLDTPIFDPDVIADLENHFDDVVKCMSCDAAATVRGMNTCCNTPFYLWCPHHLVQAHIDLSMAIALYRHLECLGCGHPFKGATKFEDIIRVVDL